MLMNSGKCAACTHSDVCKYKEIYKKAYHKMEELAKSIPDENNMFSSVLDCDSYKVNTFKLDRPVSYDETRMIDERDYFNN